MSEISNKLREMAAKPYKEANRYVFRQAAEEIDRLQRILDSRPAINAGLPESYVLWSQSIYVMEFNHATAQPS